jgi:hypothetical protein
VRFVTVAAGSGVSTRINPVILDGCNDFRSTFNTGPGRNSRASPFGAKSRSKQDSITINRGDGAITAFSLGR